MAFGEIRKKLILLMSICLLINSLRYYHEHGKRRLFRYGFSFHPKLPINVSWDTDDTKLTIYFQIEAEMRTTDLLGIGFSDRGEVEDADFVIFWFDSDEELQLKDIHTDNDGVIRADFQQDYELIEYQSIDDVIIDFKRNYETNDPQDYTIDRGTTHVVVFLKKLSQLKINNSRLISRDVFVKRVQLLKSQLPEASLPDDTQALHIHVDKVQVPREETTYWCSLQTLPDFKSKHHIIKFEGKISEQTKEIVHHLEVFHCEVESSAILPVYDSPCPSMSARPPGLESCTKVLGAWAMGANGISYPEEAGAPIGGQYFSRYIMLEIHYNNPEHKTDSSGIRFYITNNLRKYDAGVMEIGLEYTNKMALPPNLNEWKLHGHCVSKCTQIALPNQGIYIFASQLHAHLTGTKIYTKHFRDGVELPEVNRDDHYSPHFQEIRLLPRIVHIRKGDELKTTCVDQTLSRKNITLGGFSIYEEMCVNYIHYYPVVDLEVCKSSISTKFLMNIFKYFKMIYEDPIDLKKDISYNYHVISWTDEKIEDLRTFYDSLPLSVQCNRSNGERFPGTWEPYPIQLRRLF